MSRKQLMSEMGADEVYNWMAYDLSINPEKQEKYLLEIRKERSKGMSLDEEARAVKLMFQQMGL